MENAKTCPDMDNCFYLVQTTTPNPLPRNPTVACFPFCAYGDSNPKSYGQMPVFTIRLSLPYCMPNKESPLFKS